MADYAQLVFCPYNYIINPVVRGAMEVDIKEAIIILDEAQYVILSPGLFVKSHKSEIKCSDTSTGTNHVEFDLSIKYG